MLTFHLEIYRTIVRTQVTAQGGIRCGAYAYTYTYADSVCVACPWLLNGVCSAVPAYTYAYIGWVTTTRPKIARQSSSKWV